MTEIIILITVGWLLIKIVFRYENYIFFKKYRARAAILNWINLPDNWDGYGAEPLTENVINDAIKFVEKLPMNTLPPTSISPSADNEIVFEWRILGTNNVTVVVSVYGDKYFHCYSKINDSQIFIDDAEFYHGIDQRLLDILKHITAITTFG